MKQLILGGARSGKSRYAESLVLARCATLQHAQPIYLATGWAGDDEMVERIAHHQQNRSKEWLLVEEPLALADAIERECNEQVQPVILVDCLTLWLSNCLHKGCWYEEKSALVSMLNEANAEVVFVSNEVGSGIVPLGELSRAFVDQAGWLNQALAELCDSVELVVAGLPLKLK